MSENMFHLNLCILYQELLPPFYFRAVTTLIKVKHLNMLYLYQFVFPFEGRHSHSFSFLYFFLCVSDQYCDVLNSATNESCYLKKLLGTSKVLFTSLSALFI